MSKSKKSSRKQSRRPLAFENVKGQLAYCGLWCGSCSVGNGQVNELARLCAKKITDYGVHEWGPKEVDFKSLLRDLAVVSNMEPCRGCIKGGGRTDCEIRACATEKGLSECVDCGAGATCKNIKLLGIMRTGASGVGMKVKDKPGERAETLRRWLSKIDDE